MTGKRTLVHHRLHHPTQSRETSPQIGHSGGDPNPCSRWQTDHRAKHSSTVRSATTSTDPAIWIVPFDTWISIVPDRRAGLSHLAASAGCPSETFTGSSGVDALPPSRPSR